MNEGRGADGVNADLTGRSARVRYEGASKPRIISKMIESAFQIPDHVAIRIFVCAPPRRRLSLNYGAIGDGFPARLEKV